MIHLQNAILKKQNRNTKNALEVEISTENPKITKR
jgi:hypothetical protein